MQQKTSLHIATPCHEDWNAMTPAKAGKFCTSCSKQVVDFTLMSDKQILQFLAQHSGGLCGRFYAEQLERPLVEPVVNKQRSWWLALALPFSLLFEKSWGQSSERTVGKLAVKVEQKPEMKCNVVMGAPLPPAMAKPLTLQGTLRDEAGRAVEYASVVVKGTGYAGVSDSAGRFSVQLHSKTDSVVVVASLVGHETVERKVSLTDAGDELMLTLPTADAVLEGVVVTDSVSQRLVGMLGGISVCRRVTYAEKRDSAVRKVLRLAPFRVYPNPARSGSRVEIIFKKAGAYEMQLLNGASLLLKTEAVQVKSDGAVVGFQLPANLAAGVYYLRLLSEDRNRSYIEKILVN